MFDKEFEKYFEISVFQMVPIRTDNNLWKLITLRRSYHMVHGKYKVQGCVSTYASKHLQKKAIAY